MLNSPRLNEWLGAMATALDGGALVKLALNKPTPGAGDLKSIDVRPLLIKGEVKLSFTYHHKTNDIVKNYTLDEAKALLVANLSEKFANGRLFTLDADLQLTRQGEGHAIHRHPPTEKTAPKLDHNRVKNRILKSDKGWMHGLGLSDADGNVLPTAQDKYRQINKYIETLDSLIKQLPADKSLNIVDMGAGKGYLTFALYDHLANTLKRNASVTGVEFRPELVKLCNEIATGSGFKDLHFKQGTIEDYDCTGADIVIALHACDTATDDAIAKAINANAALIVVAPCCHKQIRREMRKTEPGTGNPYDFLLKHGTYAERIAEMVTDGLRAELMELSGYKTNLFEFISDTHTPKNVMIVAVKQDQPVRNEAKLKASIEATKARFGIGKHYLENLLAPVSR
ncbi:MAG: class I SAM-dependent methyltransferase [Rhizobiaceae bacterium]